ncbi:hypothetical protein ACLOJK_016536 [Asimina triloba]
MDIETYKVNDHIDSPYEGVGLTSRGILEEEEEEQLVDEADLAQPARANNSSSMKEKALLRTFSRTLLITLGHRSRHLKL